MRGKHIGAEAVGYITRKIQQAATAVRGLLTINPGWPQFPNGHYSVNTDTDEMTGK